MFGYVRPYKPEMKIKDYAVFNSVYCGLCHSLKKRYGFPARMMLSYDATFLAVFRISLSGTCPGFGRKRCIAHPFRKRSSCAVTEDTLFCADVAAILFYYKLKDSVRDSRLFKKLALLLLMPYVSHVHRKAAGFLPEAEQAARRYSEEQERLERENSAVIDAAAEPTGKMLSSVMQMGMEDGAQKRILARFGYFLGRWIYLADAADDVAEDLKTGNYNPFAVAYRLQDAGDFKQKAQKVEMLLNACIYEMCAAYELLEKGPFDAIVGNILYLGLPHAQKRVLDGQNKKKDRDDFNI